VEVTRSLSVRIIAFAAFSALCYFGADVIITIVLAVLAAYVLDPFVSLLTRIKLPRSLAILIAMFVAGCVLAVIVAVFVDRIQDFSDSLPNYASKIQKISRSVRNRVYAIEKKSEDISKTILPKTAPEPKPIATQEYSTWSKFFFRDLGPFYEALILISFFPFLLYFLLYEKDEIRGLFVRFLRNRTSLSRSVVEDTSDRIAQDLNSKIGGFVFGYLLSSAILFALALLSFFAFQVQEAFIWALIYTLLGLLPFVGAILSLIPPILIAVTQFTSLEKGISFVVLCLVLHLIFANWLIPRTTGKRTELSPLVVLLAMMYWGALWGAIGIFLAIPLTASLRTIYVEYRELEAAGREKENEADKVAELSIGED
jgi:predicted PurR-regulated permease PerM